jgi:S1-C subfamily serine protease
VIVSENGYILTSTTAAPPQAQLVEVYFADHTHAVAKIVAAPPDLEIAILKVARRDLPFLPWRDAAPQLGEPAYACGNANNMLKSGAGAAVGAGVVSSIYQLDNADAQSAYRGAVIETDCAINPGQDGGPLVDAQGCLLGIISRGFSWERWQGAAIPAPEILRRFPSLRKIVSFTPVLTAAPENPWGPVAEKYRPALVTLTVEREFSPERLPRGDFKNFLATQTQWEEIDEPTRRRRTAEFFARDGLLAANQMIRRPGGAGSGVLVSAQGHILTAAFNVTDADLVFVDAAKKKYPAETVVAAALAPLTSPAAALAPDDYFLVHNPVRTITATLADGRTAVAKIVVHDAATGYAVLKIELTAGISYLDMPVAAGAAATGAAVAIVGAAPFSLNVGIVSATERDEGKTFQFDAKLNYGNAGGLLLAADGTFLGIATAPLLPAPLQGKILPFTRVSAPYPIAIPADADQAVAAALTAPEGLSDYRLFPNSGIGMAVNAATLIAIMARFAPQ